MKIIIFVLCLFATAANAKEPTVNTTKRNPSSIVRMQGPSVLFHLIKKSFPDFVDEQGKSPEILLKSLTCSASNVDDVDFIGVKTECNAINYNDKTRSVKNAPELFLALLLSGLKLDKKSEPGTGYVVVVDINCKIREGESIKRNDPVDPEYMCTRSK